MRNKELKPFMGEPVRISWEDATGFGGEPWQTESSVVELEPMVVTSVGIVVGLTQRNVFLAQDSYVNKDGVRTVNQVGSIPVGNIISCERLLAEV